MKLEFGRTDKMHGDTSRSLLQAIRNRDTELAKRILMARTCTNIDRQSSRKDGTPLYWACCLGYIDLAHLLLLNGADANATTCWGATPLHACVDQNYGDIATLLVRFGANVNQQTMRGDTPCHLASYRGYIQCIKRLTDEGADVDIRNNKGRTPVEEAYVESHCDVYRYLVAVQQLVRTCHLPKPSMDSIQRLKVNIDVTSLQSNGTSSLKVRDAPCTIPNSIPTNVQVTRVQAVTRDQRCAPQLPAQTDSCSVRSETDCDLSETDISLSSLTLESLYSQKSVNSQQSLYSQKSLYSQDSVYSQERCWNCSESKESNIPVQDRLILRLRERTCDSDSSTSSSELSCSSLNDLSTSPSTPFSRGGRVSVHKLSFKNI